jgi:AcrR family transcriptional regulator
MEVDADLVKSPIKSPIKSPVQRAVEIILDQPCTRLDSQTRRERTKAAMIMECAQHGYALAKVASVATRAKISTATIYRDFGNREALLRQSLELAIGLFGLNWVSDTPETEPIKRIEALLLAHGEALADPFMGWIFRLYVHLANTTAPHLLTLARVARDANLVVWHDEIKRLEDQGHLMPTDRHITVAILLGAIERRTIFARLAFGENDQHEPRLPDVARHMALALFQVFGTKSFGATFGTHSVVGWTGDAPPDHGQSSGNPASLLQPPSQRLTAYAERIFARDVNRLDAESRKVRIQLAALLECLEFGYEAATMASVAARAGVSTATFYQDYPDKRALFIDAMILQARFSVDYNKLIDPDVDPAQTITDLVYSISNVLADPNFLWFHKVSMTSEISDSPTLIASSRATRARTEGFWLAYLAKLVASGFLRPNDLALTMNALLGATQRRSVLGMVFFGVDDVSSVELSRLARASTDFVLRLVAITPR